MTRPLVDLVDLVDEKLWEAAHAKAADRPKLEWINERLGGVTLAQPDEHHVYDATAKPSLSWLGKALASAPPMPLSKTLSWLDEVVGCGFGPVPTEALPFEPPPRGRLVFPKDTSAATKYWAGDVVEADEPIVVEGGDR